MLHFNSSASSSDPSQRAKTVPGAAVDVFGSIVAPVNQAKIGSFFKVMSWEERESQRAREAERRNDEREVQQAREAQAEETKKQGSTHDVKIAAGYEPKQVGYKRKLLELESSDHITSAKSFKLAEDSRPRRQFKEDEKKNNKACGRMCKPENVKKDAKKMNWSNPQIWAQIEAARIKAGYLWRPGEICRQAKLLTPQTFHRLREQVVGTWIDKNARAMGQFRWLDSVLENVATGAALGGQSTRAGILTSYPDLCKKICRHLERLRAVGIALTLTTIRAVMVASIKRDQPHIFERVAIDGSQFRCSDSFVRKFLRNMMDWSKRRATHAA
ncbi:DDE-1 domain-containing protein [Mycena venus]|uniref:DDE-1 domain-containing protein n=1 Tax=Mycena venus TaxID=2733690 RepID=A0A8H7DG25_9AGAR|nr:DDE-1 domain-containing protein [Mycena venus]